MRWFKEKTFPNNGETRIVRKFLFWPRMFFFNSNPFPDEELSSTRNINTWKYEYRWLEFANIKEYYSGALNKWYEIAFVDENGV
jgi:hypothetical protein